MEELDLELKNALCVNTTDILSLHKEKSKRNPITKKTKESKLEINYDNYLNGRLNMMSYKLIELKESSKKYKLKLGGNKYNIIERITNHFIHHKNVMIIQKCFRKWISRVCEKLRGPAYTNKSICVNETDFISMEPVIEIPDEYFYSFKDIDENGREYGIYGFNIASLIQYIKMNKRNGNKSLLQNPYNRKHIPNELIKDIIHLYHLCFILYPPFKTENEPFHNVCKPIVRNPNTTASTATATTTTTVPSSLSRYTPNVYQIIILNEESTSRYNSICEIRTRTLEQRINEVFMEIDRLGNYTNVAWFLNLERIDYMNLYRVLFDLWNYRNIIPRDVRMKICPFHTPFEGIFTRHVNISISLEEIRLACLIVFENLVYSGVDEDHRKLGSFHALSGLTIVSRGARNAMPWLYESLVI
jgi:hypothetical protein